MPTLGSWGYFQGGGPGGADLRVGDVGANPPHGTVPGKLSTWGHKEDNGETDKETGGGGWEYPPLAVAM